MILYHEGDSKLQELDAQKVLQILTEVYPGHPWGVHVRGGIIHIKHYLFGNSGWGMTVKFADVAHDAAVLKREIIMKAGEWLERAGLVRGRENGDEIIRVEGIPEKYQPNQKLGDEFAVIVNESGEPLRTTPRPQAL